MFSIQTNVNSLIAQENLRVNSNFQGQTIQRLTSGYRINQSGDDAAGLAVANKFRSDVAELTQGVHNANDGISSLQIIDGGMNNISKMLDRLKTLASQSASQTFTGDRGVLNSEFQSLLTEINRQAQAIGLDQNGLNAKSLSVFVGGGRAAGTGAVDTVNGSVTMDLTSSTVDTASLGLNGMQVVGSGSTDMSGLVQSIVQNLANTTATTGYTDFFISGPGFSDGSKVKVSVNLSGVGDMNGLVNAVNTAVQNAGNDNTQAAAAFKAAGIVASVYTAVAANGAVAQKLAFTSSNTAFQVEAGDMMSNALLGNFAPSSTTTGAAIATTVTGGLTAATGSFDGTGKTVRIQGAGLAAPVDLHFSTNVSTIAGAITDLVTQVSQNGALKAAGISLAGSPGAALVFTNSRGESFNVMSSGDSSNQLGLGTFVTSAGKVDYNTITGANYDYATAQNDQASLEFSINGKAATPVTFSLSDPTSDAVAAARKTSVITGSTAIVSSNTVATGSAAITATDWSSGASSFTVAVSGTLAGAAQTINLATTNYTGSAGSKTALVNEINGQLQGAKASINATGELVLTANSTGAVTITVAGAAVNAMKGGANGQFLSQAGSAAGNDKLTFSVDGVDVSTTLNAAAQEATVTGSTAIGLALTKATNQALVGNADVSAAKDWTAGAESFTVQVNIGPNTGVQTVNLRTVNMSSGGLSVTNKANLLAEINGQLVGVTAAWDVTNTNRLVFTADTSGVATLTVSALATIGTAAPVVLTTGAIGTNKLMVSLDGASAKEVDVLNGTANVAAVNSGNLTSVIKNFQDGLDAAFTAGKIVVNTDSSGKLTLTSTTKGAASGVSVTAIPTGLDTAADGLTALFGGVKTTQNTANGFANTLATSIQSAIDSAVGASGTRAHATVTVNSDNSISITNDTAGAAHSISAFTGNAAVGGPNILSDGSTGALVGLNRSGTDMKNYLNQVFSTDATLKPAQLKAIWVPNSVSVSTTDGSLQIVSGNNTNFRVNSGTTGSGAISGSVDVSAGIDFTNGTPGGSQSFKISVNGAAASLVTLNTNTTSGTPATARQNVLDALNAQLHALGVTATLNSSHQVVLTSDTVGGTSSIEVEGPDTTGTLTNALTALGLNTARGMADADLGFGVSGHTFTSNLTVGAGNSKNFVIDAGGASSAVGSSLSFSALDFGNDAQAITIAANDSSGVQRSTTITLKNIDTNTPATDNRAGVNIDSAIAYINSQLQQSNIPVLKKIVAVKEDASGTDKINFISSLSSFNVSMSSTANADGVNAGASKNIAVGVVGSGSNIQVDTKEAASVAVSAISAAITKLGAAQAAVGKGQNQLNYALNLAQSQISNFSAAESRIRDADVASEAANLTKAQVLQQASIAAMAQANSSPQAVLALLRG